MKDIKHSIFWPTIASLAVVCVYSVIDPVSFVKATSFLNQLLLDKFGWLYAMAALLFFLICLVVYFSPLAKIKIGGPMASPILSKWRWFSITLCTTIATGILFWGTAEPLFHLHAPPQGMGIAPNTATAAQFSLSTMFMHWSLIPYGIYTLAALMFALCYYNLHQPFSLGAMLYPLFGKRIYGLPSTVIDSLSLFSLVAGMAASLGAGIIILSGGLGKIAGIPYNLYTLGLVALLIVLTFVISAATGLLKGIRFLSDLNMRIFIGLAAFVFLAGPTLYIIKLGGSAFTEFLGNFFNRSTIGIFSGDQNWANNWTIFYWANWLAWTPVTAIFLGRISRGYTIRAFIHVNLFFPALFACVWMMIFSGTALNFDLQSTGNELYQTLQQEGGVSLIIYEVLERLPWPLISSAVFLFAAFLSYVTAADSNTSAMSGISSSGISPEAPDPSIWLKLVWGISIGIIAWVMIAFSGEGMNKGIDGIRTLSNLGGFPALILILLVAAGMIRLILKPNQLKSNERFH